MFVYFFALEKEVTRLLQVSVLSPVVICSLSLSQVEMSWYQNNAHVSKLIAREEFSGMTQARLPGLHMMSANFLKNAELTSWVLNTSNRPTGAACGTEDVARCPRATHLNISHGPILPSRL